MVGAHTGMGEVWTDTDNRCSPVEKKMFLPLNAAGTSWLTNGHDAVDVIIAHVWKLLLFWAVSLWQLSFSFCCCMYLHFLLWQDAWVGIDLQYLPESVSRVRQVCSEWKLIWRSLFSLNQRVACFSLNQRQIAFIQIGLHDSTCSKWSEHGKRLTLELSRTWLLQVTRLYASRRLGGGHPLGRRLRSPNWIQFADGKVNLTRVDFATLRACQEMWTIWTCQFLDQVRVTWIVICFLLIPGSVVLISIEFHNSLSGSEYMEFNLTDGDFYRVSDFGIYAVPCNPGQATDRTDYIRDHVLASWCYDRFKDHWLFVPSMFTTFNVSRLTVARSSGDGCTTPVRSSLFVLALPGDYDVMVTCLIQ